MTTERSTHSPGKPTDDRAEGLPDDPREQADSPSHEKEAPRPTPVRELMEEARTKEPTPPKPVPAGDADEGDDPGSTRIVDADGEKWMARAEGATRSGSGRDAGAPLLLVTFARGTEAAAEAVPEREALAVATSLEGLSHDALVELLARSRPYRNPDDEPPSTVSD